MATAITGRPYRYMTEKCMWQVIITRGVMIYEWDCLLIMSLMWTTKLVGSLSALVLLTSPVKSAGTYNYNNLGSDWTEGSCSTVNQFPHLSGQSSITNRYNYWKCNSFRSVALLGVRWRKWSFWCYIKWRYSPARFHWRINFLHRRRWGRWTGIQNGLATFPCPVRAHYRWKVFWFRDAYRSYVFRNLVPCARILFRYGRRRPRN